MRLSNVIRDNIIEKVLSESFDIIKEEVLNRVKNYCLEKIKEAQKDIDFEPTKKYINYSTNIYLEIEGPGLQYNEKRKNLSLSFPLPCLINNCSHTFYGKDDKVVLKAVQAINEADSKRKQYKNKLHTVLYSVSTTKKLLEIAPEFEKYFTEEQKIDLPVSVELMEDVRELLKNSLINGLNILKK